MVRIKWSMHTAAKCAQISARQPKAAVWEAETDRINILAAALAKLLTKMSVQRAQQVIVRRSGVRWARLVPDVGVTSATRNIFQ